MARSRVWVVSTHSVLNRWREAGSLPRQMPDSTVVFLTLHDGVKVPLHHAFVLTTEKKATPIMTKPVPGPR